VLAVYYVFGGDHVAGNGKARITRRATAATCREVDDGQIGLGQVGEQFAAPGRAVRPFLLSSIFHLLTTIFSFRHQLSAITREWFHTAPPCA